MRRWVWMVACIALVGCGTAGQQVATPTATVPPPLTDTQKAEKIRSDLSNLCGSNPATQATWCPTITGVTVSGPTANVGTSLLPTDTGDATNVCGAVSLSSDPFGRLGLMTLEVDGQNGTPIVRRVTAKGLCVPPSG